MSLDPSRTAALEQGHRGGPGSSTRSDVLLGLTSEVPTTARVTDDEAYSITIEQPTPSLGPRRTGMPRRASETTPPGAAGAQPRAGPGTRSREPTCRLSSLQHHEQRRARDRQRPATCLARQPPRTSGHHV